MSRHPGWIGAAVLALPVLALPHTALAAPSAVSFAQSAPTVEAYDFVEITVSPSVPDAGNPFTDAAVTGWFARADARDRIAVEGFCDSAEGSLFRIRFTPSSPGSYTYE